jgi:hypothetical protein
MVHQTYELYLTDRNGATHFEALTCPPDRQVREIAKRLLAERGLAEIEVRRLGKHQFTVHSG